MRIIDSLLFFVMGAVVGILLYANYWQGGKRDPMPEYRQQVLLERIKKVAKLITVEGEYSNVHEYKDYKWADVGMMTKKAIVKVKAKVSVGYDLSKATYEADSVKKVIRVKNLPKAEILSVEHDLQYYDISQGMFNSFSEEDYNNINIVVKKKLTDSVATSPLIRKAEEEGIATLDIMQILVEQGGWTLEVIRDTLPVTKPDTVHIPDAIPTKRDSILN